MTKTMSVISLLKTMSAITHTVVLYLLLPVLLPCGAITSLTDEEKSEKQLHEDLINLQDSSTPPPTNKSDPLSVKLRFILKSFEFDAQEEVFSLYTWMFIHWKDDRLKWDPKKYNGLEKTEMTSLHIWTPMFRLFNSADVNDYDRFFYVDCEIKYTGEVLCIPKTMHETTCSINLKNWPHDREKCSVIYGAYMTNNKTINLSFNKRAIRMSGAEYGAEWTIVDYEQVENQNSEKQLTMIFTVEREAQTLAALVIYPSHILVVLTIVSMCLDGRSNVRLFMVCFSLFCHYYFLSELGENIPKASIDTPTIILYYRALEILTIVDFLLTMCFRILCRKESRPPNLIMSLNDFISNDFGRFLVYLSWDSEHLEISEETFSKDWATFANILNSVCFIIFVIVYVSLYFALMPQPYPIIN